MEGYHLMKNKNLLKNSGRNFKRSQQIGIEIVFFRIVRIIFCYTEAAIKLCSEEKLFEVSAQKAGRMSIRSS